MTNPTVLNSQTKFRFGAIVGVSALALALGLAACGQQGGSTGTSETPAASSTESSDGGAMSAEPSTTESGGEMSTEPMSPDSSTEPSAEGDSSGEMAPSTDSSETPPASDSDQ